MFAIASLGLFFLPGLPSQTVFAAVPVTQYQSFAGNINFVATGATMMTGGCTYNPSSSAALSGIPVTATITAAYLYWAGSGDGVTPADGFTVDLTTPASYVPGIAADRTFTESINVFGTRNFFSGFKDITAEVAAGRNGTYTVSNLTVDTSGCGFIQMVVAGWGLFVIYDDAAEANRVINVYDGLQAYQGSSLTLTPSNFRVPNPPLPGSTHGILTWEGDVANSGPQNGFTEDLTFNGVELADGLNPINNQFNSTINVLGSTGTLGIDLDVYSVDGLLSAGDTSATSVYSSGQDVVVLNVEILSVSNSPVADLGITKSHAGNFTVGQNGVYTISVSNNGPSDETGTITVTDTLPAGLSYVTGAGTGWTCGAVGQDVTCTHAGPLANGASLPDITLTVGVGVAAVPSVTNTASVSGTLFDNQSANDSSSDLTTVLSSNLSISTKTVVDLNGGEADAGDTLRYTITLTETGGIDATGVSVTDNLPTNTTGITNVSFPAGATNNSTTSLVDISNITVPANTSETIMFDVTVSGIPGDLIDNTATITNPGGPGATPAAPQLVVSPSLVVTGNKPLYLDNANTLSRNAYVGAATVTINEGATTDWTLTPALATALTVDGSSQIPVTLTLGEAGPGQTRDFTLSLISSDPGIGTFATASFSRDLNPANTFSYQLTLTPAGDKSLPLNSTITLRIENTTTGSGNRQIIVTPNGSFVDLPSKTLINVGSVSFYDNTYASSGVAIPGTIPGGTAYVRAVISDPFGANDITNATVAMTVGPCTISSATMNEIVALQTASTKTYESAVAVNTSVADGSTCTASVTGFEGNEAPATQITHTRSGDLVVGFPSLTLAKSVSGTSKPGQVLTYSIVVINSGAGYTNRVELTDVMSPYTAFGLTALPPSTAPFTFSDSLPCGNPSGITLAAPEYSNVRPPTPATYTYGGSVGWDGAITAWRMFPMTGSMRPNSCFTLQYQVQVK